MFKLVSATLLVSALASGATAKQMVLNHFTPSARAVTLFSKAGSIYYEPTPRRHRSWVDSSANIAKDEPVLDGNDLAIVFENGASQPYISYPKSHVPFDKSKARGGHYFQTSTTARESKGKAGSLAKTFFDLVSASNGTVVRSHAAWSFDGASVDDLSLAEAFPNGRPALADLVGINEQAFGKWAEEAEEMIPHGHVKSPYHRVDAVHTNRHVEIYALDGTKLVDTTKSVICFETGFVNRYYFEKKDIINPDKILSKDTTGLETTCPYKGLADYHDVILPSGEKLENQVWVYLNPLAEVPKLKELVSFYVPGPKFKLVVDGEVVKP